MKKHLNTVLSSATALFLLLIGAVMIPLSGPTSHYVAVTSKDKREDRLLIHGGYFSQPEPYLIQDGKLYLRNLTTRYTFLDVIVSPGLYTSDQLQDLVRSHPEIKNHLPESGTIAWLREKSGTSVQ